MHQTQNIYTSKVVRCNIVEIAKHWRLLKCSSVGDWLNKLWSPTQWNTAPLFLKGEKEYSRSIVYHSELSPRMYFKKRKKERGGEEERKASNLKDSMYNVIPFMGNTFQ